MKNGTRPVNLSTHMASHNTSVSILEWFFLPISALFFLHTHCICMCVCVLAWFFLGGLNGFCSRLRFGCGYQKQALSVCVYIYAREKKRKGQHVSQEPSSDKRLPSLLTHSASSFMVAAFFSFTCCWRHTFRPLAQQARDQGPNCLPRRSWVPWSRSARSPHRTDPSSGPASRTWRPDRRWLPCKQEKSLTR